MSGMEFRLPIWVTVVVGRRAGARAACDPEPIDVLEGDLRALDVRVRRGLLVNERPVTVDSARPAELHTLLVDVDSSARLVAVVDPLTQPRRRAEPSSVHVS